MGLLTDQIRKPKPKKLKLLSSGGYSTYKLRTEVESPPAKLGNDVFAKLQAAQNAIDLYNEREQSDIDSYNPSVGFKFLNHLRKEPEALHSVFDR